MKILYVHRTSAQDGSAVHIDGLVEALRAHGAEVILLSPRAAAEPSPLGGLAGLRRALPRALHELLELAYNIPETVRVVSAVRKHRPDIVYERSNVFALSATLVSERLGVPRIIEVNAPYAMERAHHGGLVLNGLACWTECVAWRRADAVIAVTGELARIIERSGVARDRIHVMGNGIDSGQLRPLNEAEGKRRIGWSQFTVLGFTGFVREWNRLEMAIDLLAQTDNALMALLVVGDGPARPALEARAAALGVADRVRFTGRVPRAEVAAWSSAFDIALQPAANPYASPLKLAEYMALGRAIVAPDQPNIRELLDHEQTALLFAPGDAAEFGRAVTRLACDNGLRERLSRAAADTVRRRDITWSNNACRVLDLSQRLLQVRAARRGGSTLQSFKPR